MWSDPILIPGFNIFLESWFIFCYVDPRYHNSLCRFQFITLLLHWPLEVFRKICIAVPIQYAEQGSLTLSVLGGACFSNIGWGRVVGSTTTTLFHLISWALFTSHNIILNDLVNLGLLVLLSFLNLSKDLYKIWYTENSPV